MIWTNAKIEKTFLGIESHGIFGWGINFDCGGYYQGSGLRGVCAESIPVLKLIVSHFGPWETLSGKIVRIGKENKRGMILGIRDILDDKKEVIF